MIFDSKSARSSVYDDAETNRRSEIGEKTLGKNFCRFGKRHRPSGGIKNIQTCLFLAVNSEHLIGGMEQSVDFYIISFEFLTQ